MLLYFIIPFAGHNFFVVFFCQLRNIFRTCVQLPFTVFLYSPLPDNYAFLSLSPSQIKNIQSADTVPVHGHSPLVIKWCLSNQVDFRAPPVKSIADFLLYLFQDRKLQPSPTNGLSIADNLGNSPINVSKDENLTRLLDSFHRDRPKGRRAIPSWNLSLVLHQLTRAPFEPIKEASWKHLTFKTVFLLAVGSGKCRGEIHAWQDKNTRHPSHWSKVSLYPLPAFFLRTSWPKRVWIAWPQWLYQPWPLLWISHLGLTGPSVRSELCATIWTGPQISGRTKS